MTQIDDSFNFHLDVNCPTDRTEMWEQNIFTSSLILGINGSLTIIFACFHPDARLIIGFCQTSPSP